MIPSQYLACAARADDADDDDDSDDDDADDDDDDDDDDADDDDSCFSSQCCTLSCLHVSVAVIHCLCMLRPDRNSALLFRKISISSKITICFKCNCTRLGSEDFATKCNSKLRVGPATK
jgi:hypothetical protein